MFAHIVNKVPSSPGRCPESDISGATKPSRACQGMCRATYFSYIFLVSACHISLPGAFLFLLSLSSLIPSCDPKPLRTIMYQFPIFRCHRKHDSVSHWKSCDVSLTAVGNPLTFSMSSVHVLMHVCMSAYAHAWNL